VQLCADEYYSQKYAGKGLGNLNSHALNEHCGYSVFVNLDSLMTYMVDVPRYAFGACVYQDRYGQRLDRAKEWSEYRLDGELWESLRRAIVEGRIGQEVVRKLRVNPEIEMGVL